MKKISLFFLIFLSLYARNNPFIDTKDIMNSQIKSLDFFTFENFNFNSSARILNSISFTYTNLDGSVSTKTYKISKMINWHDTFKLTNIQAKDKPGLATISIKIPPAPVSANDPIPEPTELLKIKLDGYKITIYTDDALLRDLSVQNPSVLMLDFKHNLNYLYQKHELKNPPFKSIEFSSHKDFYRLKVYLDGKYGYKLVKGSNKYYISLY